jgi:hypothetical protein
VHPDGHLEAAVTLGEAEHRELARADADAAADARITDCLTRTLSRPTLRPRPAEPAELRVLLRYEPIYHPARPCSDPGGPVR